MPANRARRVPGNGPVEYEIGEPFQTEVRNDMVDPRLMPTCLRNDIGPTTTELERITRGEREYADDAWVVCHDCNGSGERTPSLAVCLTCGGIGEIPAKADQSEHDGREKS